MVRNDDGDHDGHNRGHWTLYLVAHRVVTSAPRLNRRMKVAGFAGSQDDVG